MGTPQKPIRKKVNKSNKTKKEITTATKKRKHENTKITTGNYGGRFGRRDGGTQPVRRICRS
jgi:hypothetical protein